MGEGIVMEVLDSVHPNGEYCCVAECFSPYRVLGTR